MEFVLMESRQKSSPEQFSIMVEFMERHGDLSKPQKCAQGKLQGNHLWQELASMLNSVGGGMQRPESKWKKVWADWKTKTKKKAALLLKDCSQTGGGPSKRSRLTAIEGRVLGVMGVNCVTGDEEAEELGFQMQPTPVAQSPVPVPGTSFGHEDATRMQEMPQLQPSPLTQIPPSWLQPTPTRPQPTPTPPLRPQPTPTPPLWPQPTPPPPRPQPIPLPIPLPPLDQNLNVGQRRRHAQTPFERAAGDFQDVELNRLRVEAERDKNLHEREIERERMLHEREMLRLHVEEQRVEVERTRNVLLQNLTNIQLQLLQSLER